VARRAPLLCLYEMIPKPPEARPRGRIEGASEAQNLRRTILSNERYLVTVGTDLDPEVAEVLWRKSGEGFSALNEASMARQNMLREEYDKDVQNPKVLKYTVHAKLVGGTAPNSAADSTVGMIFVHADARDVSWINHDYVRSHVPDLDEGEYIYISTLVIEKAHRGFEASGLLIHAVGVDLNGRKGAAVMDFAGANAALPAYIEHCLETDRFGGPPISMSVERVGAQCYLLVEPGEASALSGEAEETDRLEQGRVDELWASYFRHASEAQRSCPARQMLDRETFMAFCSDARVEKITSLRRGAGTVTLFVAKDLSVLPHLSEEFILRQSGRRPVRHIIAAGAYESIAAKRETLAVLRAALTRAKESGEVVTCDADEQATRLRTAVREITGRDPVEIDQQSYWTIQPASPDCAYRAGVSIS
jgi:hypothetical protein